MFYENNISPVNRFCKQSFVLDNFNFRLANIEVAKDAGMIGLHFRNAETLKEDLTSLGIEVTTSEAA